MSERFRKVLIANRGEIVLRVMNTLNEIGLPHVAVYHRVDANGRHVREAREAVELRGDPPVSAYLDVDQIIEACKRTGADAVHPGYGFLSENPAFARACRDAGITFIGPGPEVMALMGDKVKAREFAAKLGVPVIPSELEETDPATFIDRAATLGFPLLLKAAAGGGGKGMQLVRDAADLPQAVQRAKGEAQRYFADGRLYAERSLGRPRHIEVQVLADQHGHCLHLGERECSIQRRFQKIIEEAPAPNLAEEIKQRLYDAALRIAKAANYTNAGTVEFLVDENGNHYFLEMNTRLQVEHRVTEKTIQTPASGPLDLVKEQIKSAAGIQRDWKQSEIRFAGTHAVECRIYAEDPSNAFAPTGGQVLFFEKPESKTTESDVLWDDALDEGGRITPDFDPMLAKLVVSGRTRESVLKRAVETLAGLKVLGVVTNVGFLRRVLDHPAFINGRIHTKFIQEHEELVQSPAPSEAVRAAVLCAALVAAHRDRTAALGPTLPYCDIGEWTN